MKIKVNDKQISAIGEAKRAKVIAAVKIASSLWKYAFNAGNAIAAANQYEENAVMTAQPFGSFTGRQDIQVFWENLISQGFAEVQYINPTIEIISADSAIVSSRWKMNNAHGVITKELWVLQGDGQAKLRIDDFEVLSD